MPFRHEFTRPDEVIVDLIEGPDTLGRFSLLAYWWDDTEWKPWGVHGQAFFTHLDSWVKSWEKRRRPVRFVGKGESHS